jgi:hypothetical protein
MIIPNKFIKLEYSPTTDVLLIEWPNIQDYSLPEIRYILQDIVSNVKNYDIKKILADTRKSVIQVDAAAYGDVLNQLAADLMTTRLEKFARLSTQDKTREKIVKQAGALVAGTIQFKNFDNSREALEWLTA